MKSIMTLTIMSGVLLSTTMSPLALAAATAKPATMTCEEFIMLDDVVKPKVVYWAEGYNRKGKPVDAVVDVAATDKLVPLLVTECQKTPKAKLLKKIKKHTSY